MGEESVRATCDAIFITLGTSLEKGKQNLLWVLDNFPGDKIVIAHVHQSSKWIPMMGAKVLQSLISEEQVRKHTEEEKIVMKKLLYAYMVICTKRKVQVSAVVITKEDVFAGVLDLVHQHHIKRLVTGSKSMSKQIALLQCCQIWLVRGGKHISTSEPILKHVKRLKTHERDNENQEQSTMIIVPDDDEDLQYVTPPNELENESEADIEEAPLLVRQVLDGSIEEVGNAELLLLKEVEELKCKIKKVEKEARVAKEAQFALEELVARLQKENSEAEKEIQALKIPQHIKEYSMLDLQRATNNFHPSQKIGEGGYGPVYKGTLLHSLVAIKVLNPNSNQGQAEYQQEILILSKVRHPNIVILLGICPETSSLVYEYLPNGNLEERLARKNNTPPLPWQIRVRILVEQRCVLIYLQSCASPHAIVLGDMKTGNIILDANNVSRLGDFGTARLICQDMSEETTLCQDMLEEATLCRQTTPMGTLGYMDPTFLMTGQLTPQSDIYSFGIVILRVLTGLPVLKIAQQVEEGLRMGALRQIMDASAGEWPIVQTELLLRLALRCCSTERESRPSLVSEDWRTLEILTAMAGNQA